MSKDYKHIQTKEDYTKLLNSGMFWEFHPELSGNWQDDERVIKNINYDTVLEAVNCVVCGKKLAERERFESNCCDECWLCS